MIRYFRHGEDKAMEADTEAKLARCLAEGWTETDATDYALDVARIEAARQARMELKRQADAVDASNKARDDAAISPPEGNVLDSIAGLKAKSVEDRMDRIEAIMRNQGWGL